MAQKKSAKRSASAKGSASAKKSANGKKKGRGASGADNASLNIKIFGLLLFFIGILASLSVCVDGLLGGFGDLIKFCICYLFGKVTGVLFCLYILVGAVLIIAPSMRPVYYKKWAFVSVMMLLIAGFVTSVCYTDSIFESFAGKSWSTWIFAAPADMFRAGVAGGGMLGNLVSALMIAYMNKAGAIILLVMLMIVDLALMLGMAFFQGLSAGARGIGNGVRKVSDGVSDLHNDMKREKEQVENGTYISGNGKRGRNNEKDNYDDLEKPPWMKGRTKKANTFVIDNGDETGASELAFPEDAPVNDGLPIGTGGSEPGKDAVANDGFTRTIRMGTGSGQPEGNEISSDEASDLTKKVIAGEQTVLTSDEGTLDGREAVQPVNDDKETMSAEELARTDNEMADEIAKGKGKRIKANYRLPDLKLMNVPARETFDRRAEEAKAESSSQLLESTLKSFGVDAKVVNVTRGPSVTRYELHPGPGVKVSKVVNLQDDIALAMAAGGLRMEAPIPGKSAIGIEVPNEEKESVALYDMIVSPAFKNHKSPLAVSLGKDISGDTIVCDLAKMPHILIAGTTGAGKSVCVNSMIISLLSSAFNIPCKINL